MIEALAEALRLADSRAAAASLDDDVILRVAVHDQPIRGVQPVEALLEVVLDGPLHDIEMAERLTAASDTSAAGVEVLLFTAGVAGHPSRADGLLVARPQADASAISPCSCAPLLRCPPSPSRWAGGVVVEAPQRSAEGGLPRPRRDGRRAAGRSRTSSWQTQPVGNTSPFEAVETAGLENAAELALTSFCWWRADLPQDVCEAYWRDVHGIMFARVPGLWQYRQLRLGANRPDLWPTVQGIAFDAPDAAQPQGIPHGLFLSEADLVAFGNNPLPREAIPNDAHNFIGRIGALLSPHSSGRTLIDRINDPAMQGPPPAPTFVLCLVPRAGAASPEEFHRYLADHVAGPWSEHPDVLRLRVEPLPPYEQSAMSSPGVPHQWPTDETYLGWIELAVRNQGVLADLLAGASADELAQQVRAIHTYPIREVYTLITAGRPTEAGLRGYPAAQTITAAGADNQHNETVLTLLFGDAVRGLDQLRRGT